MRGSVEILVRDFRGVVVRKIRRFNYLTTQAPGKIAGLIAGLSPNPIVYIAIGVGSYLYQGTCSYQGTWITIKGTPTFFVTYKSLTQPVAILKAGTVTQATTNVTNDTIKISATFSNANGVTGRWKLCEAGIFDALTGGVMVAYANFTAFLVDFTVGDSVVVTWSFVVET